MVIVTRIAHRILYGSDPLRYVSTVRATLSFSRSRRVPVLRLGSRGPGGDARSLRLCSQSVRKRSQSVSQSVRKRSQSSAIVRGGPHMPERRKLSRNAELSSLFTFRLTKMSTVTGIGGVVVNSDRDPGGGRETQNCRHFWTRLGSSRLKSVNS